MSCASPIPRRPSPACSLRSSPSIFPPLDDLSMTPPSPFGLHAFSFASLPSHPPAAPRSPCSSCSCSESLSCPSCLYALASSKSSRRSGGPSPPLRTPTSRNGLPTAPLCPATPTVNRESPTYTQKFSDQVASALERSRSVLGSLESNSVSTPERGTARCADECIDQTVVGRGKEDRRPLRSLTFPKDGHRIANLEGSSLKRKRPPKLSIPECASLVALGRSLLSEEVGQENYSFENPLCGVFSKKGRRDFLEDTHRVITNFQGNPNQAFFGVFDGHGGRKAAEFVAENLPERIADAIEKIEAGKADVEHAVRTGYLRTDAVFLDKRVESGACSVSAIVKGRQLVVANAGDCRAVLSRSGNAEALTRDHRADREDEQRRIENLGGYVDSFNGVWRVQGTLCVTRCFGDMHLKQWISAEPDVKKLELTPECELLILASDGLWDKVSDQEAVDCARAALGLDIPRDSNSCKSQKLNHHSTARAQTSDPDRDTSLVSACQKLAKMASDRGSIDDITVLIVPIQKLFCKANE